MAVSRTLNPDPYYAAPTLQGLVRYYGDRVQISSMRERQEFGSLPTIELELIIIPEDHAPKKEKTVKDVYDELTDEQRKVVGFLMEKAIEFGKEESSMFVSNEWCFGNDDGNSKMNELLNSFMVMAIGDLAYDRAPIQISQFEADIRVAEWLDKVYFEGGGGGNQFESYTAAWYMGTRHMMLDSWKRGKKGIIITLGDEPLNPYLPKDRLSGVTGDTLQGDVETKDLYREAIEKFDIYHLAVDDRATSYHNYVPMIDKTWGSYLDSEHLRVATLEEVVPQIVDIVANAVGNSDSMEFVKVNGEIAW